MDKVRLGFVGAGYMGQLAHLANFTTFEHCEVVALAERRPLLARKVAEYYRIPTVYESHQDLCNDPDIDAVAEITSDDLHAPVAIDLMNARKHVFLEKPMATNVEDARAMAQAAQQNGVKLVIGYMKRYDPGVELAKQIIDGLRASHELGAVTLVKSHCFGGDWICNIGKHITTDEPYPEVVQRPPKGLSEARVREFYGINNVYCHNVNLIRHLAGEIQGVKYADLDSPSRVIVFDMGGFDAVLDVGRISSNFWDEAFKIYFEHGWVDVRTPSPLLRNVPARVSVYKAGNIQEHIQPQAIWDWAFKRADEHFIECVLHDRQPRSSGADSMRDVEVMEEIFRKFG